MRYVATRYSRGARATRLALAVTAVALVASGCRKEQPSTLSAEQAAQAVDTLTSWFECEECQAGELAAVVKYGQAVVPSLIAVLNAGLSPAAREQLRRDLEDRYDALAERARTNPDAKVASSKGQFTALYLANRDAQYRVRAAQALGAIGGTRARRALEAARRASHREDVQEVVRTSLEGMK